MTQPTAEAYEAKVGLDAVWPFAVAEGRRQVVKDIEAAMRAELAEVIIEGTQPP